MSIPQQTVSNPTVFETIVVIVAVVIGAGFLYITLRNSPRKFDSEVYPSDMSTLDALQAMLGICPACHGQLERFTARKKNCHDCRRKYQI